MSETFRIYVDEDGVLHEYNERHIIKVENTNKGPKVVTSLGGELMTRFVGYENKEDKE